MKRGLCGIGRKSILPVVMLAWAAAGNPAPPAAPAAESISQELDAPIAAAAEWVRQKTSRMSPLSLMLLDFIQRRFDLDPAFAYENAFYRLPTPEEKETVALYRRLIDAGAETPRLPEGSPVFVRTDLMALYCRAGDCPKDFAARLREQLKEGGYGATHAALAYQWMKEAGCGACLENEPDLREAIVKSLAQLIEETRYANDVTLEAMCYLHYLGAGERIPEMWKEIVRKAQSGDGGFSAKANSHPFEADEHATLLALWLMLEWRRPNTPQTSMMRPPNVP